MGTVPVLVLLLPETHGAVFGEVKVQVVALVQQLWLMMTASCFDSTLKIIGEVVSVGWVSTLFDDFAGTIKW